MLRLITLGLGILVLATSVASATTGDWVDVTCPVCENKFQGYELHSTNTFGGQDRDLCGHAAGDQPFLLACWTCPQCAYTGHEEDFDPEGPSKELIARLKVKNPLVAAQKIDPKAKRIDAIPAWIRWDLDSQVDVLKKASAETRAWGRLRTAQTQRFQLARPKTLADPLHALWSAYFKRLPKELRRKSYDRTIAIAKALENDADNAKLPLTAPERVHRWLAAARRFLSRGESPAAARVIGKLRSANKELAPHVSTLVEDVETRIARERVYIAHAVPLFESLTKEADRPVEEKVAIRYLVGELRRKLGQPKEALRWLEPLLEAGTPDWLRTYASDAIQKTKAAMKSGSSDR